MAELFLLWSFLSLIPAYVANRRGRSGFAFFFLSLLLSPLVGLVAALVVDTDIAIIEARQLANGEAKKCPNCAEMIKIEAKVCRYCGKDVPAAADPFAPDPK